MRLSHLNTAVRDIVNDPDGRVWTDLKITRFLNVGQDVMFRHQVEADASWFNHRFTLDGDDATKIHDSEYVYYLPTWAGRITAIRESSTSSESRELPFPAWREGASRGWEFDGRRKLVIRGESTAIDLELEVAKKPAMLFRRIRANVTFAAYETGFENDVALSEMSWERDAYSGMTIEVTSEGLAAGHLSAGQIRDVTQSFVFEVSGTPMLKFIVDSNWDVTPSVTTDYLEMHAMVDDASIPYLVLLAAEKCFESQNNVNGLNSIGRDIASRRAEFIAGAAPRAIDDDKQWGLDEINDYDYDFDKDRELL